MAYATMEQFLVRLGRADLSVDGTETAQRCLDAATLELDSYLGWTANPPADPLTPEQEALLVTVNMDRAGEHWRSTPFGALQQGAELAPVITARDSFERHRPQARTPENQLGDRVTLQEEVSGLADALVPLASVIPDLQVYGYPQDDPSPPTLDLYPSNPFQDGAAFGVGESRVYMTVRVRVGMDDPKTGMDLLYRFLDPHDEASVEAAMAEADWVVVPEGVNGFTRYSDDVPGAVQMMGSEWRVSKFL